jgi:hypothetical protein
VTRRASRRSAATLPLIVLCCAIGAVLPATGSSAAPVTEPLPPWIDGATVVALADGSTAYVGSSGLAVVVGPDGGSVSYRRIEDAERYGDLPLGAAMPSKDQLARQLSQPPSRPYRLGEVVVTFADDAALPAPATGRTGDAGTDAGLSAAGVTGATAVLASGDLDRWRVALETAERASGQQLLDPARTYRLRIDGVDPIDAASHLLDLPGVAYASPAWAVSAGGPGQVPVPAEVASDAEMPLAVETGPTELQMRLPDNDAITSNAQSHWNSPGLDAASAYDRITRSLGELPGTGEIITTVGIAPVTSDPVGRCAGDVEFFGPTTVVIGDQRYLDLPSMPLVPTYTTDEGGSIDPLGEACPRLDPLMADVGMALSVMVPLPHGQQRPEALGSGLTDLLGLAPGADYRLVVPADPEPTTLDLAGALLGAAQQEPAPTVITVSADVGGGEVGFPNRSVEDDALLRSIVTTIVQGQGITVAAAAGDGITRFAAAYGPSGGAAATEVTAPGEPATTLSDLRLSTAPSAIPDSGSIMVGASTLNDVSVAPPLATDDPQVRARQAYPTVRWSGSTTFASGFGSRLDVSAPADSILGFKHTHAGGPRDVTIQLGSGTGVAAAEVAAAAAIVRQVSRATDNPIEDPAAVRTFLTETGRALPTVPQLLAPVDVGPQLDLGAVVDALFDRADIAAEPRVVRVAVAQRRPVADEGAVFETWTDPLHLDLLGPRSPVNGELTGRNARAWITIAPDWVGLPDGTTYALRVAGRDGGLLATTPSARVLPAEILAAAGLPLVHATDRVLSLLYVAAHDGAVVASATVTLGFGPSDGISQQVHAPVVDPVVTGDTVRISYDLTDVAPVDEPELVVSFPGRPKPEIGPAYVPALRIPLDELVGTVEVPVEDLQGGGLYGVAVHYADLEAEGFPFPLYSDFGFFRLAGSSARRPPAPLLARAGDDDRPPWRHFVRLDPDGSVEVTWDASDVPGATGAKLEVSAAGPTIIGFWSTFNNPDGTVRDDNGNDTGSVTLLDLPALSGAAAFSAADLGLFSTMTHGLRVLAVDADGAVVGSAGPVSSVTHDGVAPSGGGSVELGYGIDPARGRGLLTTYRVQDSTPYGSAQVFDLESKTVTHVPIPETGDTTLRTLGSGVFGRTGLVQEVQGFQWAIPRLGKRVVDWAAPKPDRYTVTMAGSDLSSRRGAFLLTDHADPTLPFRLVTGQVRAQRFGPVLDVGTVLGDLPETTTPLVMAYDETAGVAAVAYAYDFFAEPVVEVVDVRTGQAVLVDHDAFLYPAGLDVLSPPDGPDLVAFTTFDGKLTVAELDGTNARSIPLTAPSYVNADDEHGLLLVAGVVSDLAGFDKNDLSTVQVFNTDLELLATIKRFNLDGSSLTIALPQLTVDPATRTGWFVGPHQEQIAVFAY